MPATATPEAVRLTLRDYQEHTLERIAEAEGRGVRRQLMVLATGLGKTVIFCSLAERRRQRTLILAHRDELIGQAARKVREVWPSADVGIVKASDNDVHADVVVASVQTLARQARLDKLVDAYAGDSLLRSTGPFGLVIIDEAHHAAAASYGRIVAALGCGTDGGPLLLGATATPNRADGQALGKMFDEIVDTRDILWGIRSGYLADLRGLAVRLADLDMADVTVKAGDYDAGAAGRVLTDAHAPAYIVKAWREHAADRRRTLAFAPTVALARDIADAFQADGVPAGIIEAATPSGERRRLLADFSAGRLQVLSNCGVLTEGYDEPTVDCVIVARPTKSAALYTQMIGRGTRRHPDKADCLVLDVVGASDDLSLLTIPTVLGVKNKLRRRAGDGTTSVGTIVAEQEAEAVRLGTLRAEELELFNAVRSEGIAWVQVHREGEKLRRYVRPLGKDQAGNLLPTVVLAQVADGPEGWTAGLLHPDDTKTALIRLVSMELAQGVAEDYIRRTVTPGLVTANAGWRKRKPSAGQVKAAGRWRLKVDPAWSAGELSDALDTHIARIQVRRARPKKAG